MAKRKHHLTSGAARFERLLGEVTVNEITAEQLKDYIDTPSDDSGKAQSLKTWNNRRGYLGTFFKFCMAKGYVGQNPVLEVPQYKIKKARGTADTLFAKEAKELMLFLETYRGQQNKNGSWWGVQAVWFPSLRSPCSQAFGLILLKVKSPNCCQSIF
jgi:site-specific recombinase XerD